MANGYIDLVTLPNNQLYTLQDSRIADTNINNWNEKMFCYLSDETLVITPTVNFDIPEPGSDTF